MSPSTVNSESVVGVELVAACITYMGFGLFVRLFVRLIFRVVGVSVYLYSDLMSFVVAFQIDRLSGLIHLL